MKGVGDKGKVVKLEEECYGSGDEDDCYEIDSIDFFRKCYFCASDEVAIVAEKGDVALRDYPHPRHLCGNYPFNKSPHESYCSKCFCYVCQSAAPCKKWRGINGHCHVSEKNNAEPGREEPRIPQGYILTNQRGRQGLRGRYVGAMAFY